MQIRIHPAAPLLSSCALALLFSADVAFLNPDGTHMLVECNTASSTSATFEVVWNGSGLTYALPHQSVVTFKW
jgi:O-glycosyl hydrolase